MSAPSKNIYNIPLPLSLILVVFDAVALVLAFLLAHFVMPLVFAAQDYAGGSISDDYLLFNILIICMLAYRGLYRKRIPYWQQVGIIGKAILSVLVITGLSYFIFDVDISLLYVSLNWCAAMVFLIIARILSFRILRGFKGWHIPVTLLGDNQMVIDCLYAFDNDGQTGFEVHTVILKDEGVQPVYQNYVPEGHSEIQLITAQDDYLAYIRDHTDQFYILDMEALQGDDRERIVELLETENINYAIVPPTKRLHLYGMKPSYFFGNDLMILHSHSRYSEALFFVTKRAFDVCVSFILLPILGIFTGVIYVMKKMDGADTPLFYGGKRVGLGGAEFSCWKFCTMRRDADKILDEMLASDPLKKAEWDQFQKLKDDPRIDSRISKVLRRTSMDELPQIWNVFVGDMSLVGPRPMLPFQREEYGKHITMYEQVRPGITGLWQVSGRNETTFEQRVYWDGWYIKNFSLWHDIVILLKTVSVLLTKRGAG